MLLFPFSEFWWFYLCFVLFVLFLLLLDLGVFHKTEHEVGFKESLGWSVFWIILALLFNLGFYFYTKSYLSSNPSLLPDPALTPERAARELGLEFLAGYLVEKALSVDNLFVFLVIFSFFGIPGKYQHRILFYGILGALIFRAIFIAIGSYIMNYHAVVIFFGILLLFTGLKIIFVPEKEPDLENNRILKLLRKAFPVHPKIEGKRFFFEENGKKFVTPLFVALIFIEFSDVVFAIDSVPAIFGLTKEPLIVFTSNIFAILGLRSLYFLIASSLHKFRFIKFGLGAILAFVGLKMVWLTNAFGGKFPINLSLSIIGGILLVSILASLLFPAEKEQK